MATVPFPLLLCLVFAAIKNALIPWNSSVHCSDASSTLILSHKMGAAISSMNASYARYAGHGIALGNLNVAFTLLSLNHGVPSSSLFCSRYASNFAVNSFSVGRVTSWRCSSSSGSSATVGVSPAIAGSCSSPSSFPSTLEVGWLLNGSPL